MKKIAYFLGIAIAAIFVCGCSTVAVSTDKTSPALPKKVNVALFVDNGSSGIGVFDWAKLMEFSPDVNLHFVLGKDVRAGKLSQMDVLLMPGGYPGTQYKSLQKSGVDAVHKFIENGGAYIGSCAGLANVLNNNNRLRLLPFRRRPHSGGHWATLTVDINADGAKILGVKPGRVLVNYAGGPIPMRGRKVHQISTGEILAVYKNTVSYVGKPEGNFFDQGAIIYGQYGKGKVIATSFHPENWSSTRDIAMGCLYAVTGVKTFPVMPKKNFHPFRVGYFCSGRDTIDNLEAMLRLYKHPQLDIIFFSEQVIRRGELRHIDVLVLPDANAKICRGLVNNDFLRKEMEYFISRGGRVIIAGRAVNALQDDSKAIKVKSNEEITPELLLKALR